MLWDGRAIAADRSTALRVLSTSYEDALAPIGMQADSRVRITRRDGGATPQDPQDSGRSRLPPHVQERLLGRNDRFNVHCEKSLPIDHWPP